MRKEVLGRLSVLKFENLRKFKSIVHFITTKEGWILGDKPRFTGDEETIYLGFRKELAVSCKWNERQFVFPRQTHSDHIALITSENYSSTFPDTDALITDVHGLVVCVQTADCVPILLFDPVKKVVAAIHAGWRGTVSKIASKTVQKMKEKYGCSPENMIAGIGPSIHMHAYEIGPEVIAAVKTSFNNFSTLIKPSLNTGKAYFDLWEANRNLLMEAGLHEENVETMGLCSFEHAGLFYSARREGSDTGRMVTGIRLVKTGCLSQE